MNGLGEGLGFSSCHVSSGRGLGTNLSMYS